MVIPDDRSQAGTEAGGQCAIIGCARGSMTLIMKIIVFLTSRYRLHRQPHHCTFYMRYIQAYVPTHSVTFVNLDEYMSNFESQYDSIKLVDQNNYNFKSSLIARNACTPTRLQTPSRRGGKQSKGETGATCSSPRSIRFPSSHRRTNNRKRLLTTIDKRHNSFLSPCPGTNAMSTSI